MSDEVFLILVAVVFGIIILGAYIGLRILEKKYELQVEKIRKWIALYSVPLILLLMFTIGYFNSKAGINCSQDSEGIAFWTCNVSWLLFPLLLLSISLTWTYSMRLRKRLGWFERITTKDKGKLPRWRDTYSKFEIAIGAITLLFIIFTVLKAIIIQ